MGCDYVSPIRTVLLERLLRLCVLAAIWGFKLLLVLPAAHCGMSGITRHRVLCRAVMPALLFPPSVTTTEHLLVSVAPSLATITLTDRNTRVALAVMTENTLGCILLLNVRTDIRTDVRTEAVFSLHQRPCACSLRLLIAPPCCSLAEQDPAPTTVTHRCHPGP